MSLYRDGTYTWRKGTSEWDRGIWHAQDRTLYLAFSYEATGGKSFSDRAAVRTMQIGRDVLAMHVRGAQKLHLRR